jgi:light-regulated signal transduction histidine kinase (bacteriophytochrome)
MKYLKQIILYVLTVLVFWLDHVTPIGLAIWLLYYILLMIISHIVVPRFLFVYSSVCTFFIIVGGLLSTQPELKSVLFATENRVAAIIVLWILTYTFYRNRILSKNLQKQKDMLINANKDLESFNYTISHDLKNPLIVIGGFGDVLQDSAIKKLDNDELFALSGIVKETRHMNSIIADLLRLSRITKQEMKVETVDMSTLAQDSFNGLTRSTTIDRHYEFYCQQHLSARVDPGLMRILFDNLLGNAIKFSSKTDSPRIEFGRMLQNDKTEYYVKDNGAGFDTNQAARIFEPYTRLHSASEFPGTGIGLSIVKKIIDKHQGTIRVESAIGKGTTIYFTFLAF